MVGAVLVVFLEEFLRDFKDLRFSIFGLIVIGVVIFLPRGLMGFITRRHEIYDRKGDATHAATRGIGVLTRRHPFSVDAGLGKQGGPADA